MTQLFSRRQVLAGCGASLAVGIAAASPPGDGPNPLEPFRYCLNMATLQGFKLPLDEQVDIAARAGYRSIEPWLRDLDAYLKAGKSLKDLTRRIHDQGLTVEDAIGFATWIVDDDTQRKAGIEELKRDMERLARQKTSAARWGAAIGTLLNRPSSIKDLWALQEKALIGTDRLGRFLLAMIEQLVPAP